MKNIYLAFAFLSLLCSCQKAAQPTSTTTTTNNSSGFDRTTPEGKLLVQLESGSNRKYSAISVNYYNSNAVLIGTFNESVPQNTYILFGDPPAIKTNPTYRTYSNTSGTGIILNNTTSDLHIDNGVDYLYYQPDPAQTPTSAPSTVQKIEFSLSADNKTMTMIVADTTPGTATEGLTKINYAVRIYTYTLTSV